MKIKINKKQVVAIIVACVSLLTILFSGITIAHFVSKKDTLAVDDLGNSMYSNKVYDMPKNLTFNTVSDTNTSNTVTLKAVVKPLLAVNYTIDYKIAWADESVTDTLNEYISMTSDDKNVTLSMLKKFNNQIKLIANVVESNITTSCMIDCYKDIVSYDTSVYFDKVNHVETKNSLKTNDVVVSTGLLSFAGGYDDSILRMTVTPLWSDGTVRKYTNARLELLYANESTLDVISATENNGIISAEVTFNQNKLFKIVNDLNASWLADGWTSENTGGHPIKVHSSTDNAYYDDLAWHVDRGLSINSIQLVFDVVSSDKAKALNSILFASFNKNTTYVPVYSFSLNNDKIVWG